MLVLHVNASGDEVYDEETGEFKPGSSVPLRLEHSLYTISKWEEKWKKPFLSDDEKTEDEMVDYIRCMAIDDVPDSLLNQLTQEDVKAIGKYISDDATATTINDHTHPGPRKHIITSEVIYYWMFSRQIPMECEHWHLNRLITLMRVWDAYSGSQKKMSRKDTASMYARENARRKAMMKSKG